MKNFKRFFKIIIFSIVVFAGCKKNTADKNGCYDSITAASQNACKNNLNIFLIVTMSGNDDESENFIKSVIEDKDFKEKIASKYSVVHMDFSEKTYQNASADEDSPKKQQKEAEYYSKLLKENSQFVSLINVTSTPAFYLLTKEKYFITEIFGQPQVSSVEELCSILDSQSDRVSDFVRKVWQTKKGSKKEKIAAIQNLFDDVRQEHYPLFEPVIDKMLALDKNNSTGSLSKYLMAKADAKAVRCFLKNDAAGSAKSYLSVCGSKYLTPDDRQNAYYLAAYIFSMTRSAKDDVIVETLQNAIDAIPESDKVPSIQRFMDYVKTSPQNQAN